MTKVSSRGECGDNGWVPIYGMAPLSWRFSDGLVSASTSSGILSSSVWENSTVGWTMTSISPIETSCIIFCFLICPARSGVLAELKGEFSVDLTYS